MEKLENRINEETTYPIFGSSLSKKKQHMSDFQIAMIGLRVPTGKGGGLEIRGRATGRD